MDIIYLKRQLRIALWVSVLLAGAWCGPVLAKPPQGSLAKLDTISFTDNEDGSYTVGWLYTNPGDYDQNGEVNIADISALGLFSQQVGPFDPTSQQFVVDGDQNGEINISDVSVMGLGFMCQVSAYNLYVDDELAETVPFSAGLASAGERLSFSVDITPAAQPYEVVVVPTDGESEGTPTALITGLLPPALDWVHTWGGGYSETINGTCQTDSGQVVAVGQIAQPGNGLDALLLAFAADGEVEHSFSSGGTEFDALLALEPLGDRWLAAGTTGSSGAGGLDCWLVHANSEGQVLWSATWGGIADESVEGIVIDRTTGDIWLAGWTESYGAGSRDGLLLSYNDQGNLRWARTYGGTGSDQFTSVLLTASGDLLLGGTTDSAGLGGEDLLLALADNAGNLSWQYSWGGPGQDQLNGLVLDQAGSFVATGTTELGLGGGDAFLLKHDLGGQGTGWGRSWGGYGWEGGTSLLLDSAGWIIMSGATTSTSTASQDLFLGRFDPDGFPGWIVSWGASDNHVDGINALGWGNSGTLLLGGFTGTFAVADWLGWEELQTWSIGLSGGITQTNFNEQEPVGLTGVTAFEWLPIMGNTDYVGGSQDALLMQTEPAFWTTPY